MIPIYRAKRKDSDKYIDGYLGYEPDEETCFMTTTEWCNHRQEYIYYCIDPSTLEISFDSGKTFRSMEEMKDALAIWDYYFESME